MRTTCRSYRELHCHQQEASKRWDAYVGRVAEDLRHHDWARVLEALPEDSATDLPLDLATAA